MKYLSAGKVILIISTFSTKILFHAGEKREAITKMEAIKGIAGSFSAEEYLFLAAPVRYFGVKTIHYDQKIYFLHSV